MVRTLLPLLLLVSAACSASRADLVAGYGGESVLAVVEEASELRGYRLDPERQPDIGAPIGDYAVVVGPVEASAVERDALVGLLTRPGTFHFTSAVKGCLPRYGVRLELVRDSDVVDLLVCYECEMIHALQDGANVGGLNIDPSVEALRTAVDAFLP